MLQLLAIAGLLLASARSARASESDPWTYAHIPLADSAAEIIEQLSRSIKTVIDRVNATYQPDTRTPDDTALEFAFFAEHRAQFIRDYTWGMFERCIGSNSCADWPQIERIQMYPEESVYAAAGWRFIPAHFHLASIVNVCGVRMGADKLTHFFDDGFHYYNALRSKRKKLEPEDIRQLSMVFELSYMGTRITGIASRADIEANLAGVQYYGELFGGKSPMIGRGLDGRLVMLRRPDICDYVTPQYDERILPNEYRFSLINTRRASERARELSSIIQQRSEHAASLARELSPQELARETREILARSIPLTHWQSEFPRLRLVGLASGMAAQWLFSREFREVSNLFGFNPLKPGKLGDRKPVTIKRVDFDVSGT